MQGEAGQGPWLPLLPPLWGLRHPSLRKAHRAGGWSGLCLWGAVTQAGTGPVGLWAASSHPVPAPASQSQGVL